MKTITRDEINSSINIFKERNGSKWDEKTVESIKVSGKFIENELLIEHGSNGIPFTIRDFQSPNLIIEQSSLVNSIIENVNIHESLMITDSWLENNSFKDLKADELTIEQSKVLRTNFTNIHASDIFIDQTIFDESEIIGGDLSKSYWDDIKFRDGTIAYTDLEQARFTNVEFVNTHFHSIDFNKIDTLENVSFKECIFEECELDLEQFINKGISLDQLSKSSMQKDRYQKDIEDIQKDIKKAKQERFLRLLAQVEIHQEGPYSSNDVDILRATYKEDMRYNIVFGLDSPDQVYNAVYQGGDLIRLQPQNEDLFYELSRDYSYPSNTIINKDKSYILSVSNDFTKKIEEFKSIKSELAATKNNFVQTFENNLNEILKKDNPVDRLHGINDLRKDLNFTGTQHQKLKELLNEIRPTFNEIIDNKTYRPEFESEMQRAYKPFKNPNLLEKDSVNAYRSLDVLTSNIANLEMQTIRQEGLEGTLFKLPEQAVIFSRFDVQKPFHTSVNNSLYEYSGPSKYLEKLIQHQITEPTKIVEHYLSIHDSIENSSEQVYSNIDKSVLSKYAIQAVKEANKTIESEMSKVHPEYSKVPFQNIESHEASEIIEETKKQADMFRAVPKIEKGEPISIFSIVNTPNLNNEQEEYWNHQAEELIKNQTGISLSSNLKSELKQANFKKVINSIEKTIDAEIRNHPLKQPKLEMQMLEYVKSLEPAQIKKQEKKQQFVEIER